MWGGGGGLEPSEDSRDFNYFGSPRIEIIEITFLWMLGWRFPTISIIETIEIGSISIISIIEMWGVGLEPSEDSRDFNYFASPRIGLIEITLLWMLGVGIPHHFNN